MANIDEILANHSERSDLIDVLEEIQDAFGHISDEHMQKVEQALKVPLVDICSVVTFYSAFKLNPPGRHVIKVCQGTACHVKRGDLIKAVVEEALDVKEDAITRDGRFSLETVNCIGACAKAPAMMIDDKVFGELTKEKIEKILAEFE